MVELNGAMIHFHDGGCGAIAVIPDQAAFGKYDMDLVVLASDWVLARRQLRLQDAINTESAAGSIHVHLDGF